MFLKSEHFQVAVISYKRPKFTKECPCPTQEEIHFFPSTLRCFNFFANAKPFTDKQFDSLQFYKKVV